MPLYARVLTAKTLCAKLRLAPVLAATLATLSLASHAQDSAEERLDTRYDNWYQIEVVVFERTAYDSGDETWPRSISMSYPRGTHHLLSEEQWAAIEPLLTDSTEQKTSDTVQKPKPAPEPEAPLQVNTSPFATEAPTAAPVTKPLVLPEMETPRILLDSAELALNNKVNAIKRSREFKLLAHKGWRQALLPAEQSRAIAFSGGNAFEQHQELEGWIKLSLNRFLRFESNLWKVDYEINYGQSYDQDRDYWPNVPAFPDPIAQLNEALALGEDPKLSFEGFESGNDNKADNSDPSYATVTKAKHAEASATNKEFGFGRYIDNRSSLFNPNSELRFESNSAKASISSYDNIQDSRYVVKEIITLKQARRMRSEELHYIDHPRMGILVYVTPYTVQLPLPEIEPQTSDLGAPLQK